MTTRTTTRFTATRRAATRLLLPTLASAVAITGIALGAGSASAATTRQTLSYGAVDDAYSWSNRPTFNSGAATKLVAGAYGQDTAVTYLKFSVGTLPAGAVVERAELTLTRDEHRLPPLVRLSKVASTAWTERKLTAQNRPALGAAVATVRPARDAATVTFDVRPVVTKAGSYSFAVTAPVVNDVARFRSAEYRTGRPVLTLVVRR
ncbi:MAG TPA: DNRLRE domain-containing protein, partial [Pilimelia sp.]|nr:DNRLRE domain-containing protein [Pilimelia sp.]